MSMCWVTSCIRSTSGRSRSSRATTSPTAAPSSRSRFQLMILIVPPTETLAADLCTLSAAKNDRAENDMKVVITGGAGFLGKKLARRILQQGTLAGLDGRPATVSELLLFDVGKASGPGLDDPRVKAVAGDIANVATV